MNVIYFHLMSFFTNQQANRRIRRVLKDSSGGGILFHYDYKTRVVETRYRVGCNVSSSWVAEVQEQVTEQILVIECERRKTLDQLYRELHCQEDQL